MYSDDRIRIESLGKDPVICVLLDRRGNSLGTGSREVLEVLLYIAEQCDQTSLYHEGSKHQPLGPILQQLPSQRIKIGGFPLVQN
jgi:hypothetical protein